MSRYAWLELALDYRCNLRCLGCRACEGGDAELGTEAAVRWMRHGRSRGIDALWLGGGEPTLRADVVRLVKAGRALGYREVCLQSNGLRLSYPHFRDGLLEAGLTSVRLNIKSSDPEIHDRLSGAPGAHGLVEQALEGLVDRVPVIVDVLVTRSTAPTLSATVARYAQRGVKKLSLWLLSAADSRDPAVLAEVPSITAITPFLRGAQAEARRAGAVVESFHTPPCALPEDVRGLFVPASSLGLLVVDPSEQPFDVEGSPVEGGAYLPGCGTCSKRTACPGPRADYLALHGPGEMIPLPPG
jgi:hypothetical protein